MQYHSCFSRILLSGTYLSRYFDESGNEVVEKNQVSLYFAVFNEALFFLYGAGRREPWERGCFFSWLPVFAQETDNLLAFCLSRINNRSIPVFAFNYSLVFLFIYLFICSFVFAARRRESSFMIENHVQ